MNQMNDPANCQLRFLKALANEDSAGLDSIANQLEEVSQQMRTSTVSDSRQARENELWEAVSRNVFVVTTEAHKLVNESTNTLKALSNSLSDLILEGSYTKWHPALEAATSKRQRSNGMSHSWTEGDSDSSPPSSPLLSINNLKPQSLPSPPKSVRLPLPRSGPKTHQSSPNLDILREWFLHHLANPYPTPEEKESLANQARIPRSKVDSDLTNWRRRAGWTDIKDQWANGDRKKMRQLVEKVEAGEEKRKVVVKAVEGVKSYLRREEEEKVGDWVHQLTGLITPKQETPRSVSNASHITSSSDESTNTSVSAVSRQARASKRRTTKRSTSSLSNVSDTLPLSPETAPNTKEDFIFAAPTSSIALNNILKRQHESEPEAEGPRKIAKAEQLSPSAELTVSLQDGSSIEGGRAIWSTEGELPMLPHMMKERTDCWTIPEHWEFRPAIGVWSE